MTKQSKSSSGTSPSHIAYKVVMHKSLEDRLDEELSPIDGLAAINDVYVGLPRVHVSRKAKHKTQDTKTLRVHTARLSWYPLAISYVQVADTLHILDIWCDDRLGEPDGRKVDAEIIASSPKEV